MTTEGTADILRLREEKHLQEDIKYSIQPLLRATWQYQSHKCTYLHLGSYLQGLIHELIFKMMYIVIHWITVYNGKSLEKTLMSIKKNWLNWCVYV